MGTSGRAMNRPPAAPDVGTSISKGRRPMFADELESLDRKINLGMQLRHRRMIAYDQFCDRSEPMIPMGHTGPPARARAVSSEENVDAHRCGKCGQYFSSNGGFQK